MFKKNFIASEHMTVNHVKGNPGTRDAYAAQYLCWCKKTKSLLEEMNVEFYYADVDLCRRGKRRKHGCDQKWNPVVLSFRSLSRTAIALSGMMNQDQRILKP